MKKIFPLCMFLVVSCCAFANVHLPKIFGDNMVLQRNKPIPVWGWADANETIVIQFNQQTKSVRADKNGHWMIKLDDEVAGGPYELFVKGNNSIAFNNVLIGEVWICSGQSNMEMPIEGWGKINNYTQEIKNANYPQIRHIKIPNSISSIPEEDIKNGEWKICSPETAGDFTAVGYFFARELYNQLKIPVGLINTSWGGTHVETWTSREALENSDEFKNMIAGMPNLNLDSLAKVSKEAARKKIEALQGSFDNDDSGKWKDIEIDNDSWPKMGLPGLWEDRQLADVDGVVWFRKTITLSAEDAGKAGILELAMIDDNDITYVNGVRAGSTDAWNVKRKYNVPAGILKAGKNIIAVRVEDTGGGGGIYGDSTDMKLTVNNHTIALAGDWLFRVESVTGNAGSIGPNSYPALLFNAMINPLIPYAIKGVIWYQGEANADRAYQYRKAFPLMITDWRQHWSEGDFPFYFVQLASFNSDNGNSAKGSTWAELREAQTSALSLPNTGMAVTTDIGDAKDIHPKNKQDVGKRLAAIALHNVYKKEIVYSGPMYKSMEVDGNKITIYFTNTGTGLMGKGELKGFEIAGADKKFYPAIAAIKDDQVVVHSENVNNPVAVRFGWADDAGADNLYNKEGFPASPFRTDNWKGITEEKKFTIGQ
jgi:sialate O-acetylesterase